MRIVCLCGSIRFRQSFLAAEEAEARAGNVALAPVFFSQSERRRLTLEQIEALHLLHRQKIDMADELLIVAPNGYVGESTTSEIEYGRQLGKPIRYWEDNSVGAEGFDPVAALRESYEAQRLGISEIPTLNVPAAVKELRCALIEEEARVLREALEADDIVAVADAIAGLLYVVYGAAITLGIPLRTSARLRKINNKVRATCRSWELGSVIEAPTCFDRLKPFSQPIDGPVRTFERYIVGLHGAVL